MLGVIGQDHLGDRMRVRVDSHLLFLRFSKSMIAGEGLKVFLETLLRAWAHSGKHSLIYGLLRVCAEACQAVALIVMI